MPLLLGPFPDGALLVISALGALDVDGLQIGRSVPPDPASLYAWLPFLRVRGIGGVDNLITDTNQIDVDAFAATRPEAFALAESVRQLLLTAPTKTTFGVIDHVVTTGKPSQVPYGDETDVVRYAAAYKVTARRS